MNLVLIGFRGCGKSSVGRQAAIRLGLRFVDTDRLVEEREGKSVADIFSLFGEARFRRAEAAVIATLAGTDGCLVAAGGGAPCGEGNRAVLSRLGRVVWLKASPATVLGRMRRGGRPALTDLPAEEEVETLMRKRHDDYAALADAAIDTDGKSKREVTDELEHVWRNLQGDDVR